MHQGLVKRKKNDFWRVVFFAVLAFSFNTHGSEIKNEEVLRSPAYEQRFDSAGNPLVEVEPTAILTSRVASDLSLIPYKQRRREWGLGVSVGYGQLTLANYEPTFLFVDFNDLYDSNSGLIEVQFNRKRNFSFGSLGYEITAGIFSAESGADDPGHTIQLIPIKVGVKYVMDMLFSEPYVAPYVSGGGYTILYSEEFETNSFNGNTQVTPYFTAGLLFQLDWMDKRAAVQSFIDSGIENTFIYVEGIKYFASSVPKDPDFETEIFISGGLSLEF